MKIFQLLLKAIKKELSMNTIITIKTLKTRMAKVLSHRLLVVLKFKIRLKIFIKLFLDSESNLDADN
jgi:hypothetical protein